MPHHLAGPAARRQQQRPLGLHRAVRRAGLGQPALAVGCVCARARAGRGLSCVGLVVLGRKATKGRLGRKHGLKTVWGNEHKAGMETPAEVYKA